MVVRSSEVACPQIFPDGLTVHCTDKAGHCLIFFIVIISLSDWPSSLVSGSTSHSESEMLSVDLICVISATPSSPDLQFSLHGTSKFHWKFCFAQGRAGAERREKCEGNTMCDVCPLWTLPVTGSDITPDSRQLMQKISFLCGPTPAPAYN